MMRNAHFPGRPPIDAYGNGGFRFADMSHIGSILILPSGVYGWLPKAVSDLDLPVLEPLFDEAAEIDFLLLGTGSSTHLVPDSIRTAMRSHAINLDVMSTGAAARTWNVILPEKRRFAAALVAVE